MAEDRDFILNLVKKACVILFSLIYHVPIRGLFFQSLYENLTGGVERKSRILNAENKK